MKELSFEKMEELQGGYYCALICHWYHGGGGYQGSWEDLQAAYYSHCQYYC
jgi:hypothetical protein